MDILQRAMGIGALDTPKKIRTAKSYSKCSCLLVQSRGCHGNQPLKRNCACAMCLWRSAIKATCAAWRSNSTLQPTGIGREMGRLLAVAVLLVGLAGGLRGSPFLHLRSGTTTGSNAEEIALYAGPVDSCEVPATHTCGVDYEVPSSVARVAEAVERYINLTYSEDFDLVYSAACGNATRRIVCSQRFPRCVTGTDGEKQVVFSSLQCELELRDNCGTQAGSFVDMLTSKLCSVEDSTSDVGECKSVLQYATDRGETGQFGYCVLSEDWKVTEWMYQYLKYFDQAAQALVQVTSYPQLCAKKLANFTCQSVGRCSESMESVQLINTRQLCEQAVSW